MIKTFWCSLQTGDLHQSHCHVLRCNQYECIAGQHPLRMAVETHSLKLHSTQFHDFFAIGRFKIMAIDIFNHCI